VTLRKNTPTRVGKAMIAAGNIWEEEGGLTAQLWIHDPDPAMRRNVRVHPGQELEVSGARLRVVSIDRPGVEVDVDVEIETGGSQP
jgi:hypothetical protein